MSSTCVIMRSGRVGTCDSRGHEGMADSFRFKNKKNIMFSITSSVFSHYACTYTHICTFIASRTS